MYFTLKVHVDILGCTAVYVILVYVYVITTLVTNVGTMSAQQYQISHHSNHWS